MSGPLQAGVLQHRQVFHWAGPGHGDGRGRIQPRPQQGRDGHRRVLRGGREDVRGAAEAGLGARGGHDARLQGPPGWLAPGATDTLGK